MAVGSSTTLATVTIGTGRRTINNVQRKHGLVTVTVTAAHNMTEGQIVTVAAGTNTSINGTFGVVAVPSDTTFTYKQDPTLVDIASGSDTGTADSLRDIVLPNGREYQLKNGTTVVTMTAEQFLQIDPKWVGSGKLLTDTTA